MIRPTLPVLIATIAAACSSGPQEPNPPRLWLALQGAETEVRLVPEEPPPY